MRKLNFALFFFAFFFAFMQASAQNAQWALHPIQKFDVASGGLSAMAGAYPSGYCGISTGLFDASGNPIFYVSGRNLYGKGGAVIYDLGASPFTDCPKGVTIVPVPGATCAEYFILYTIPTDQNLTDGYTYDGYSVNALRVRVDAALNVSVLNIDKEYYAAIPIVVSTSIEMAVGKEVNGTRRVYAAIERDANPGKFQIVDLKLDNAGLTQMGGFQDASVVPYAFRTKSLEMSPNQAYLAWHSSQENGVRMRNISAGTEWLFSIPNIGNDSDIEFSANSNSIYITTTAGIVTYNLSNNTTSAPIANTSVYYGSDIELGIDGRLYMTGNNYIASYDFTTQTLRSSIIAYTGRNLPEQVDGENIKFNGITSYGGAMSLGVPAACSTNPFMANLSGLNQGTNKSVTVKVTDDANNIYILASGNLTVGATYGLNLSNIAGTGLSVYLNSALPCAKNLKVAFTYNSTCGYSQEVSNTTSLPCCCTTAAYNYSLTGNLTTCPGDDDATAIFTGNFTFQYLGGGGINIGISPSTTSQGYLALSGLAVGTYQVKVTGAGGCSTIRTFNITQKPNCCNPCPLSVKVTEANGILTANVTGGSGNYSYVWNTVGGTNYSNTQTLTPCGNQTHTLIVTDNTTGCVKTITFQYAAAFACQAPPLKGLRAQQQEDETLKVYPNPTADFFQIEAGEAIIEQVQMIDMQGKVVATEAGKGNQMRLSTQNAGNGMYILHITTDKGTFQKKVSVQK